MMSLDREQIPRRMACDFLPTHRPFSFNASSTFFLASKRCWPLKGPPTALIRPLSSKTLICARPCLWPHLKSLASCAGVIFTHPVPKSRSTIGSATTTILRSGKNGCTRAFPTKALYLSSSGCTATAVSPSIVSSRVVATTRESLEPLITYLNSHSTPTSTLSSYPGMLRNVLPGMSSWSTSRSESAVFRCGHQFTRRLSL
mmetsp:Transcript_107571/g.304211  ORF Transcript_107571/g.304211 Transcript_107571/m.304211 type:complete len:201 (-) Transcript_107571:924-1526(-)